VGLEDFFAPARIDREVKFQHPFAVEGESVVDAVVVGREGIGYEYIGLTTSDFSAMDEQTAPPGAS
jgi:hypothetical protein